MTRYPGVRSAIVAVVFSACCCAQTTRPQSRDLLLIEGRGDLLTFQRDVTKVAISEPKVADAIVISPREVMVNAKAPGRATLTIWATGAGPEPWLIQVT